MYRALKITGAGLAIGTIALSGNSALAAVRLCRAAIEHIGRDHVSEQTAKRKAIVGWQTDAARHGIAFTQWRLALARDLSCLRDAQRDFVCRASARPCGIEQVPDNLPPGIKPATPQQMQPKRGLAI